MLEPLQYALGGLSGLLVGATLGLVGGGGSILAVPLIVYLVGVADAHVAIGTSAFAVSANAAAGLLNHARQHHVKWRCGGLYAAAGIVGAAAGSTLGKLLDGERLLFLFALLMLLVGAAMLRKSDRPENPDVECDRRNMPGVLGLGVATGAFSGFFGIGGGFLIVPGLIASTGMPMLTAVGTSLVAVTAFGLTTAINYALSGLVNWPLAIVFIAGGTIGSLLGTGLAARLGQEKGPLKQIFAALVLAVAVYMIWRSLAA
jgi:uncharacterized membrane protein YfcA